MTGFASYLATGEFTPDFISDVDLMIKKAYRHWSLYESLDEFSSFCWAKIVNSIGNYDESIGTLGTFLHQVIKNEANRIYSKHKRMSFEDIDSVPGLECRPVHGKAGETDLELRDRLCTFARAAYGLGVRVDQGKVYRNYLYGCGSPGVKAFIWHSVLTRAIA